ncbi:MAG: transcriptional repressor [Spirochaetes bacterium]|nr:MAG: transcriptional repressor [Spirochaetota bacterium]
MKILSSKYKRSKQRERILELLRGTHTHPSADWIYEKLKKEFSNLSMGTVYRNLTVLMEQGLIRKIDFGSTFDRFDANTANHYHFICESCGEISDVDMPFNTTLNETANRTGQFSVRHHRIEFYGTCGKCGRA